MCWHPLQVLQRNSEGPVWIRCPTFRCPKVRQIPMPGLVFRNIIGKNNSSIALLAIFKLIYLSSSLFKCHWSCCHRKSESSELPFKAKLLTEKKRHRCEANANGLYITETVTWGLLKPHLTVGQTDRLVACILLGSSLPWEHYDSWTGSNQGYT